MCWLICIVCFTLAYQVEYLSGYILDSNKIENYQISGQTSFPLLSNDQDKILQKTDEPLRCGSVLTDGAGIFYYKPFEQVLDNERCVWIIATPNATEYSIDILYLGSPTNGPGSSQELILSGITTDWTYSHAYIRPSFTSVKPTSTGNLNITNSNILLVTFTSSSVEGTSYGFALEYKAISGSGNVTSARSTHHLFDTSTFNFKYPVESTRYDNFELASFVFLPKNNINAGYQSLLGYQIDGNQFLCPDYAWFYKFNNTASALQQKWTYSAYHCLTRTEPIVVHDDLVLVIFSSDHELVNSGFFLHYASCPFI